MPVQSIEVTVDGDTFRSWATSLQKLRQRATVWVKPAGNVSGLPPLPGALSFRKLRLLHDVGLAATRPHVLDDPARLFAVLRYASSLSGSPGFTLDQDVLQNDVHKRKVLSDELGCGFAFLFARRVLGATRFLDLKTAVDRGMVKLQSARSRQPDFVALGSQPDRLMILEAKGTQTGATYSRAQVKSGCGQVAACRLTKAGYTISCRAAVGILLRFDGQRDHSVLHVGDPPEERAKPLEFDGDPAEVVLRAHYARLAAFVGDDRLLFKMLNQRHESTLSEQTYKVMGRSIRGTRLIIRHDRSMVSLFAGIDDDVRDLLLNGELKKGSQLAQEVSALDLQEHPSLALWSDVKLEPLAPEHRPDRRRVVAPRWEAPTEDDRLEEPAITSGTDGSWVALTFEGPIVKELRSTVGQRSST